MNSETGAEHCGETPLPLPSASCTMDVSSCPADSNDRDQSSVKFLSENEVEKLIARWERRNRLKKRLIIGISACSAFLMLMAIGVLLAIIMLQANQPCNCSKTTISNMTYRGRSGSGGNSTGNVTLDATALAMVPSPYSDCGSQHGRIDAFFTENCIIDGDRCRYDRYATGKLDVSFTLTRPTKTLTLVAHGVAEPVPFLEVLQNVEPKNVCESLQCPLQPNTPYSLLLTQVPPKDMLFWISSQKNVRTRVKYQFLDDTNSPAICLNLLVILI